MIQVVAPACNASSLRNRGRQITLGEQLETSLANTVKPRCYEKFKKISQEMCWAPVIPATQKAEAGESL